MTIPPIPNSPPKIATTVATVELSFEIAPSADGSVPTEAHILPSGYFRATDGRPYCCAAWLINADIAKQVIARMATKTIDTLIDYEHQSLYAEWNGVLDGAAGWFRTMEWREDGLYAINIAWNAKAKERIAAKEMRYTSAVFNYYENTGEVLEILSFTLTNNPALDTLNALTALSKRAALTSTVEDTMPQQVIATLTVERDNLKTQVATLTSERDELKTNTAALTSKITELEGKLVTLEQEKVTAALTVQKTQCEDYLKQALASGLTPDKKAYLTKNYIDAPNFEGLKEAVAVMLSPAAVALLSKQHSAENTGDGVDENDAESIADRATAYQVQQAALGRTISDEAAVSHVMKGKGHV